MDTLAVRPPNELNYSNMTSTIQDKSELTSREAAWREELRSAMSAKERTAIPRVEMPHVSPEERIKSNVEVNSGLTHEMALTEASRCLDCPNPGCITGCPVGIDIPAFVKNIQRCATLEAAAVLKATSALPAVCGRVCPQEKQCESKCIYLRMGKEPVAIGYLERFAADAALRASAPVSGCNGTAPEGIDTDVAAVTDNGPKKPKTSLGRIAVVGSGPAGLSFSGQMALLGYEVDVFEALHEIGGVLKYGIPEFRLPNSIVDSELDYLRSIGVKFHPNTIVGKTVSVEKLQADGYRGIFVASGAGLPRFMNIPGENLIGVMSSNEYLTRVNLMGAGREGYATPVLRGDNVAVIGGGNTAMDSIRTAIRMGASNAMLVYRRGEEEMPARREEVAHAKEEGAKFMTLNNPIEYLGDEHGRVRAMRLQRMRLGEPDASGRRSPEPIEGDIVEVPVDLVIVAVGVSPNPILPSSVEGLETTRKGTLVVDDSLQSSIPGLYAGGDIVRGGATVILAMGDGRKAAAEMHRRLAEPQ